MFYLNRGFTFLEVMISFSLGFVLLAGLLKIAFDHKQHNIWLNKMIEAQENARAITAIFRQHIHQAGYQESLQQKLNEPVKGYRSWSPLLSNILRDKVKENTDILTLKFEYSGSLKSNTFFIAKTHRKNSTGDLIYALSLLDEQGNITELFENVDDLQVKYLPKFGFKKSDYLLADQIENWNQIQTCQITFVLQNGSKTIYISLRQPS